MRDSPLVSVCMITYGHEKYIEKAIEGVFMQQTNFLVELLISNDSSPDNSDDIIKKMIVQKPENIFVNYIKHEENLGAIPNFYFALGSCKGKYIAICEGDDYWTNSEKLQKQIDFLEKNPEFSASFHDVQTIYKDKIVSFLEDRRNSITNPVLLKNLLDSDWLIPTCSYVFRKEYMILPPFYPQMRFGDFILFCCTLINSKAKYFEEIMGAYRRNNTSSLTNETKMLGIISLKTDYIEFLNWLGKRASGSDVLYIDNRIEKELNEIRGQIVIYQNSSFSKAYLGLRKILKLVSNKSFF